MSLRSLRLHPFALYNMIASPHGFHLHPSLQLTVLYLSYIPPGGVLNDTTWLSEEGQVNLHRSLNTVHLLSSAHVPVVTIQMMREKDAADSRVMWRDDTLTSQPRNQHHVLKTATYLMAVLHSFVF